LRACRAEKTLNVLSTADDEKDLEDFNKELQATLPTGFGVTVRLAGEICDFDFSDHSAAGPPMDMFSPSMPGLPVNRTERGGFQCRRSHTFKTGESAVVIGQGDLNDEADFLPDDSITVFTDVNSIFLGRYGPFLKDDRKTDELYSTKNFIYSDGPAVYACKSSCWFGFVRAVRLLICCVSSSNLQLP